jgi:hypothetical protein
MKMKNNWKNDVKSDFVELFLLFKIKISKKINNVLENMQFYGFDLYF